MKSSFVELYNAFIAAPVLAHFDLARPIGLETDISGCAIAGMILQQDRICNSAESATCGAKRGSAGKSYWQPVAFWPRSMSPVEWNYTISHQEILAIITPCRHWHYYQEGVRHLVEVLTDHHNWRSFITT
jgi:hypothetical protein